MRSDQLQRRSAATYGRRQPSDGCSGHRPSKSAVTGSIPVGRAIEINGLRLNILGAT